MRENRYESYDLKDRISVCIYSASEISGTVVFDVCIDNLMLDWDGSMTAKITPQRTWQVSEMSEEVLHRLYKAARYTRASLSEVEAVVRQHLSHKLWLYEDWSFDEQRERQEGKAA